MHSMAKYGFPKKFVRLLRQCLLRFFLLTVILLYLYVQKAYSSSVSGNGFLVLCGGFSLNSGMHNLDLFPEVHTCFQEL